MRVAKEDLRRTITLSAAELKTCYIELRKCARVFTTAREAAANARETEKAEAFHASAMALYRLSNMIAYDVSGWEVLPLPEDDWLKMPEGVY